jgi:hypothetical protein
MFERYTEKARRIVFFARYEASQYGSPYIEVTHLLFGLLREDFPTLRRVAEVDAESSRRAPLPKAGGEDRYERRPADEPSRPASLGLRRGGGRTDGA